MKPLSECRLYGFVDTAYLHGRSAELVGRQLCEGGVDLIQLRAKGASLEAVRKLAESVHAVTQPAGVGLVVNDHIQVAEEIRAELCHLGQEDFFGAGFERVNQLRARHPGLKIGISTHEPEQALRAVRAGADYIAIGPVYSTPTKPTAAPVTLEYVRWAAQNVTVPWFAIGGINLKNMDAVLAAGAKRICVVSDVLNSPDIAQRCREFRAKLDRV